MYREREIERARERETGRRCTSRSGLEVSGASSLCAYLFLCFGPSSPVISLQNVGNPVVGKWDLSPGYEYMGLVPRPPLTLRSRGGGFFPERCVRSSVHLSRHK